jgi:hypothetical protein
MARAVIKDVKSFSSNIKKETPVNLKISEKTSIATITNKTHSTSNINTVKYPITEIDDLRGNVDLIYTMPFRVRFVNIGIGSYGPNNPAPIGIAVIGLNNYIL